MKVSTLKLIEIMARIPLFKSLTPYERERVLKADCKIDQIHQGTVFIKEASQDPFFYIILAGVAQVRQGNNIIATLGPGEFIGEVGFFCQEPRSASVSAMNDMLVMKINQRSFQTLPVAVRERIKDKVIAALVARVNNQNKQIIELQSHLQLADGECAFA